MSESGLEENRRPSNVAKLVAPWLLEGMFIVISVLLGFAAAQYGQSRADRNLAHQALTNLQAELEYNLAVVEPYIAFHRAHIRALVQVEAGEGVESGFQVVMRLRPELPKDARADVPLVRRAAWDAAASSGALRLIDYELIASLSEIYQMQDHLGEAVHRIPMSSPAFFDPAQRAPSIHLTRMALNEIAWAEQSLVDLYRKHRVRAHCRCERCRLRSADSVSYRSRLLHHRVSAARWSVASNARLRSRGSCSSSLAPIFSDRV